MPATLRLLIRPILAAALAFPLVPQGASPAGAQPTAVAAAPAGEGSFLREPDYRVGRIVYRLGVAGRAHCPELLPLPGLLFHHLVEYRPEDRPEAIRRYRLDSGPGVLAVMPDSPAAAAGLRAGDALVSVNGLPFPTPAAIAAETNPRRWRPRTTASEVLLEEQLKLGPARLEIVREGAPLTITLDSVPGCPARGRLARSNRASAFADGRYAVMTTRFLRFLRNDDELAVVLAHELAHNILGHPQQLDAEGVPNNFLRHIGRNARLVRATEIEADRLSVRLLAAAGFDLDAIMVFWRRENARPDRLLQLISAHPPLGMRERYINEAIAEVHSTRQP